MTAIACKIPQVKRQCLRFLKVNWLQKCSRMLLLCNIKQFCILVAVFGVSWAVLGRDCQNLIYDLTKFQSGLIGFQVASNESR